MSSVISAYNQLDDQSKIGQYLSETYDDPVQNPFYEYQTPKSVNYVHEVMHQRPMNTGTGTVVDLPSGGGAPNDTVEFEFDSPCALITGPVQLSFRVSDTAVGTAFTSGDSLVDNAGYHMVNTFELVNADDRVIWRCYGWEMVEYIKQYEADLRDQWLHAAGGGFGENATSSRLLREEWLQGRTTAGGTAASPRVKLNLLLPFSRPESGLRQALIMSGREGKMMLRINFLGKNSFVQNMSTAAAIKLDKFWLSYSGIWLPQFAKRALVDRVHSPRAFSLMCTMGRFETQTTTTSDTLSENYRMKLDNFTYPVHYLQVDARYIDQVNFTSSDYKKLENYIPFREVWLEDKGVKLTEKMYPYPQTVSTRVHANEYATWHSRDKPISKWKHTDPSTCSAIVSFAHPLQIKDDGLKATSVRHVSKPGSNVELTLLFPASAATATDDADLWTFDSGLSGTELIQIRVLGVGPWRLVYSEGTLKTEDNRSV